jgi:CBS domain-containing protein
MNAHDIMTSTVATARPDLSLSDAIALMLEHHVSGLPVVDADGHLVGMLTEGDLLRRVETGTEESHAPWWRFVLGSGRLAAEYVRTHSRLVGDLMTREPVSAGEDTPLADIVALMEHHHIKRVPILRGGALTGVVSRADLIRVLAQLLAMPADAGPVTDLAIHDDIMAELERRKWGPNGSIQVEVDRGNVIFTGVIFDERDRPAIRVAAQNAAGVKSVRDELTWVDPASGMALGA